MENSSSAAELQAATQRLEAALKQVNEARAASAAAESRLEAAMKELDEAGAIAHQLLYPPTAYN